MTQGTLFDEKFDRLTHSFPRFISTRSPQHLSPTVAFGKLPVRMR
jgi:hypothetical protein